MSDENSPCSTADLTTAQCNLLVCTYSYTCTVCYVTYGCMAYWVNKYQHTTEFLTDSPRMPVGPLSPFIPWSPAEPGGP